MESLAKIIALYLRVIGWVISGFVAYLFCVGTYMMFQPSGHQKAHALAHSEQSPAWFVQQ